jgi:hypothetical protein
VNYGHCKRRGGEKKVQFFLSGERQVPPVMQNIQLAGKPVNEKNQKFARTIFQCIHSAVDAGLPDGFIPKISIWVYFGGPWNG